MEDNDQSVTEVEETEIQESEQDNLDESPENQAESDAPETEETPVEDDGEEIEYDGEKYKVPKALKDAFLRQADYTRKTQEVAEQRKEFESQVAQFQQRATMQQQHIQDYAQLHALDSQLERFKQVDWQTLIDTDPVEAMKLDHQYRALADTRSSVVNRIQQVETQQQFQQQQTLAKALESGHEVLKREIPNWSSEKAKELKTFARDVLKADPKALDQIYDPATVLGLHYAQIGYQSLKKASAQPPKTEAKPIQKVSTKRDSARIDPDRLSADEWVKWREKQLRATK